MVGWVGPNQRVRPLTDPYCITAGTAPAWGLPGCMANKTDLVACILDGFMRGRC